MGAQTPSAAERRGSDVGAALRSTFVYAAASALQRGIIFLLLPVFTSVIGPHDYGRLSLLLAISAAAIVLLSSGLDMAFFRTYFLLADAPARRERFVTTAWVYLSVVPMGVAVVISACAAPFIGRDSVMSEAELALALIGAALFVAGTVVPLGVLRADERLRDFLTVTTVTTVATTVFLVMAVVVLDLGVEGWLLGVVLANLATLATAVFVVPFRPRIGLEQRALVDALKLGAPLVPHILAHWGLNVASRVVLAGLAPLAAVGVYALAANVALPIMIVVQALGQGVMPAYARAARDARARADLTSLVLVQVLCVLFVATAGALLGPPAVDYLAPDTYARAKDLVPWFALGYGLLGLYFIPMNAVTLTVGRTGRVWIITTLAASASLGAVVAFERVWGLVGAAAALPLGYMLLLVGVTLYSRGPDNLIAFDGARLFRAGCVFASVYLAAVVTTGNQGVADIGLRLLWLASVPIWLVGCGVLDRGIVAGVLRGYDLRRRRVPG